MTKPQTAEVTKKVADTDKADSPRREPIRRFESGTTSVDEDSDNESSISFNGGDSKKSKAMYPGVVREKKKFKSSNKQLGIPVRFSVCAHPPSFAVEYRVDAQAPLFRSRTIFHNALVGVFFLNISLFSECFVQSESIEWSKFMKVISERKLIPCTVIDVLCRNQENCSESSNGKWSACCDLGATHCDRLLRIIHLRFLASSIARLSWPLPSHSGAPARRQAHGCRYRKKCSLGSAKRCALWLDGSNLTRFHSI